MKEMKGAQDQDLEKKGIFQPFIVKFMTDIRSSFYN